MTATLSKRKHVWPLKTILQEHTEHPTSIDLFQLFLQQRLNWSTACWVCMATLFVHTQSKMSTVTNHQMFNCLCGISASASIFKLLKQIQGWMTWAQLDRKQCGVLAIHNSLRPCAAMGLIRVVGIVLLKTFCYLIQTRNFRGKNRIHGLRHNLPGLWKWVSFNYDLLHWFRNLCANMRGVPLPLQVITCLLFFDIDWIFVDRKQARQWHCDTIYRPSNFFPYQASLEFQNSTNTDFTKHKPLLARRKQYWGRLKLLRNPSEPTGMYRNLLELPGPERAANHP